MKDSTHKLSAIIRELLSLMKREQGALSRRALVDVAEMAVQKTELLKSFDSAVGTLQEGEQVSQGLENQISNLRQVAKENAERLSALSTGVESARKRMEKIKARNQHAGAYAANGDQRKITSPSAVNSEI